MVFIIIISTDQVDKFQVFVFLELSSYPSNMYIYLVIGETLVTLL